MVATSFIAVLKSHSNVSLLAMQEPILPTERFTRQRPELIAADHAMVCVAWGDVGMARRTSVCTEGAECLDQFSLHG
jgi:hypothetical protein